jgi:hypothetical protein
VYDEWTITDAWLLAAHAAPKPAGEGATLAAVIGTADMINHAIPGAGEVEVAIQRLLGAGLISVDSATERFKLTVAGEQLVRRWRHGLFGWIKALPPALRQYGPPRPVPWSLPPGSHGKALRAYLKDTKRLAKR